MTKPGSITTPKYQIGDVVQWRHDSERVATGRVATGTVVSTVVSHNRGPLYDVEIHFNPGLFYGEMSEDQLELVHPDILRETLETMQAALKALDPERTRSGPRRKRVPVHASSVSASSRPALTVYFSDGG